jgi:hypothetical protein
MMRCSAVETGAPQSFSSHAITKEKARRRVSQEIDVRSPLSNQ